MKSITLRVPRFMQSDMKVWAKRHAEARANSKRHAPTKRELETLKKCVECNHEELEFIQLYKKTRIRCVKCNFAFETYEYSYEAIVTMAKTKKMFIATGL